VIGTSLGAAITIGYVGLVYKHGLCFMYIGFFFLAGLTLLYTMIPTIRAQSQSASALTFEEYDAKGSRNLKVLIGFVNTLMFLGLLLAQFQALWLLLDTFVPNRALWLFLVTAIVVISYTCLYGLRGIFRNDVWQTLAIVLWLGVIAWVVIRNADSIPQIAELPQVMLNGKSMGLLPLLVAALFIPWTALARADHWQRIRAATDDRAAQISYGVLLIVMLIAYIALALGGLMIRVLKPDLQDYNTAPYEMLKLCPPWLAALGIIGIYAALLSSADSFLNICSLSLVSLFEGFSNSASRDNRRRGILYRIVVAIVGALAVAIVLCSVNLGLLVILSTTAAIILVPGFLGHLLGVGNAVNCHIASIIFGIIGYIVGIVLLPPDTAFIVAAAAATIAYVVALALRPLREAKSP